MNILFALYGDFTSNSANPLALYARELQSRGHKCAVAVPCNLQTINLHDKPEFTPVLYNDALASPDSIFPDGRPADVVHACTPREVVRRFVTSYMAARPTPLVIYLEDNESWISARAIGFDETTLLQHTEQALAALLPDALAHPFYFDSFIGLADAVAVIQDKLRVQVPPWVRCETVMLGVDLDFFTPRPADISLRKKYRIAQGERVIVYHGGVDQFKSLAIETLCRAIGLINRQGFPCRLLRTGIRPLECLDRLPHETASAISDLGLLPRRELPDLLALADVFVQPGQIDPFEDLRLPGKVPEFLAMGRPVIMPNANVAHLFRNGLDVVLLTAGTAEEIAEKCIDLFSNPYRASQIGQAGRVLALKYFDVKSQARRLQDVYEIACENFDPGIASATWSNTNQNTPIRLVLARRLRAMADSRARLLHMDTGEMLREHARYIEFIQRRLSGLEIGIVERRDEAKRLREVLAERDITHRQETKRLSEVLAERERQITEFHQILSELQSSISWRVSAPIRFAGRTLRKLLKREAYESIKALSRIFGSQPKRIPQKIYKALLILRTQGLGEFRRRLWNKTVAGGLENEYPLWIQEYGTLSDSDRLEIKQHIERMNYRPLISLIMPTYNSPEKWLRLAIESVRRQLYPHWELCIADDASSQPYVRELLEEFRALDARIKVVFRKDNGHISAASNTAIEMATGEYLAFLDHDDELSEHALYMVGVELNLHPEAELIYSDEDKLDEQGRRYDPYFKPDWNPALFLSQNFLCHLVVYRRRIVEDVAGFREGYEGSQDWDLAMRVSERISDKQIRHIPHVLYHWRAIAGSTAFGTEQKSYVMKAQRLTLTSHFDRLRQSTAILPTAAAHWRVKYSLPGTPLVTLIIPTRNGRELLQRCLDSIYQTSTYRPFEIIIVDNQSDDPAALRYLAELEKHGRVRILRYDAPFNYAAINNFAVGHAAGEIIGFLNNDVEVITPDWLEEMVSHAVQPEIAAVGAMLYYPDNTIQHAGVILGLGGNPGVAGHPYQRQPLGCPVQALRGRLCQNFSAVTAACLVVRRQVFEEVGGFDETNLAIAFNDVDLCLRFVDRGYRNLWTPHAELYHFESASRGYEDTTEKQGRFKKECDYMHGRWEKLLANDPAYNPNLALDRDAFFLAFPPRAVKPWLLGNSS